jgi:hypothetical protein
MKNAFKITLAMSLITNSLIAQNISYQVIKDDPKFLFHLKGGALYDADFSPNNNRSAYFFQGSVNIGERLTISGEYLNAYKKWDRVKENAVNVVDKSIQNFSGRGSFFFKVQDMQEDTRVSLKQSSTVSGNYVITDETYIMAPARTISKVGVTGSAGYYRNSFLDNHKRDTLFVIDDENGVRVNSMNYGTSQSGIRLSGGFHVTIAKNFIIKAQNNQTGEYYGKKAVRSKTEVIAEALYMPVVGYDKSLTGKNENGGGNYSISNDVNVRNLGWRLLVDSYTTGPLGIGLRLEFGSRPGMVYNIHSSGKLKNMYLAAGFFFVFNK